MIKKTVEYIDQFTGGKRVDTVYFNLTAAELMEREIAQNGTFSERMKQIGESNNGAELMPWFSDLLRWAYGIRTEDGRFIKPVGAFDEFKSSQAYSTLFMELIQEPGMAAQFFEGMLPKDLVDETKAADLSPSEQARRASEAAMQGHKPAAQPAQPQFERMPDPQPEPPIGQMGYAPPPTGNPVQLGGQ